MELIIIFTALAFETILMMRNVQYGALAVFLVFCMIPMSFGINIGIRLNIMTLSVALLFAFAFLKRDKDLINSKERKCLILYCIYVFITSFIATMLSQYPEDFVRNFLAFIVNFILVAYSLTYFNYDEKTLRKIKNILVIFYILVGVYGIMNYLVKVNPYLMFMSAITETEASSMFFMDEERGFLQGRVSSFFSHPLLLGQITIIMFAYCAFALKKDISIWLRIPCLFLMMLMCVLCGSRSALVPLGIVGVVYFLYEQRKKMIKYLFLISVVFTTAYFTAPTEYQDSFKAFFFVWNDDYAKDANVKGSSAEMRSNQFENGLNVISNNPLFGLGQGYVSQHGDDHPEMWGYESYILQFLVDGGLVGVVAFSLFYFYLYYSLLRKSTHKNDKMRVHALCVSYFINILFTGIQTGTFSIYMVIYFWLRAEIQNGEKGIVLVKNSTNKEVKYINTL